MHLCDEINDFRFTDNKYSQFIIMKLTTCYLMTSDFDPLTFYAHFTMKPHWILEAFSDFF